MSDDTNRHHDEPVLPCENEPISEYEALFQPPAPAEPGLRGWWPFKRSRREGAKTKADVAHPVAMSESMVAGAQVAALIAEHGFEDLDGPVVRVATPDVPIPFSPPLEAAVLPSVDRVKEACRELLAY